jgi:predicted N-formylglutamate amidohydrolase
MENKSVKIYLGSYEGKVSAKVKDRGNDPYFVKKAEDAWKTLDRVGLPQELVEIRNKRIKK